MLMLINEEKKIANNIGYDLEKTNVGAHTNLTEVVMLKVLMLFYPFCKLW